MDILGTLNFWLWAAQVLLALLFGFAGIMKTFRPIPDLAKMLVWPGDLPVWVTRFIGIAEGAGALGLILPLASGILAWLTPLAAIGLAIIQALAIGFHAQRGETAKSLPINLVLLALAVFVAWGRWSLFG
ncbi:MAG: DoxX family protein [Devosia nanyangense]|uniref:DoxX family protein n=1 Tax=Devosia nanyangense TaxID=1228055 RepID=A0A933L4K1_9HYPH|nr:DoxX family protein [Devosia nanyangense]